MESRLSKLNHYKVQCVDIRAELIAFLSEHKVEDEDKPKKTKICGFAVVMRFQNHAALVMDSVNIE